MLWEKPLEFFLGSESWTEACLSTFPENSVWTIWRTDKMQWLLGTRLCSSPVELLEALPKLRFVWGKFGGDSTVLFTE